MEREGGRPVQPGSDNDLARLAGLVCGGGVDTPRIVFIAEGKLFVKTGAAAPREIESPFARASATRAEERQARHAWKNGEEEERGPFNSRALWGKQAHGAARHEHPVFRHVTRGAQPGEIFYVLSMSASAGVFRYNLDTGEEQRLFHREDFVASGLTCCPRDGRLVVASRGGDGIADLELVDPATRRRDRVTDGDGYDAFPSHHPAKPHTVCFQSAGAGRNAEGELVAFGPSGVLALDYETGALETVLEDGAHDFLAPRFDGRGRLHCIRRPYTAHGRIGVGASLRAFVLAPFHFVEAVIGFADAFTRLFARRSLRPAGPGQAPARGISIHDTYVELEQALRRRERGAKDVNLVPGSWTLLRREEDGRETELAHHVTAFDLAPDGTLVFTNGLSIWVEGAERLLVHDGQVVQELAAVG